MESYDEYNKLSIYFTITDTYYILVLMYKSWVGVSDQIFCEIYMHHGNTDGTMVK